MNEAAANQYIVALIYDRCGIRLHDGKKELIKARLSKRMRHHGFDGLPTYCEFLRQTADEAEFTQVVDALTTNFTQFLREEDHFKFLVNQALPALLPTGQRRFRIWSAACASGEEPFSLGFYLHEHFPVEAGWEWTILATDISTKALAKAEKAIYSAERIGSIPAEWQRRYFQRGRNGWEGQYRVKPLVTERVVFKQLNLLQPYAFTDTFAVIFCRNVMIYFDRPTQEQLVNRLLGHLVPHGFLIVGHAESLTGFSVPLRCLNPSVYQKT
jgi:chemotaxis protein methyltransferase CheR